MKFYSTLKIILCNYALKLLGVSKESPKILVRTPKKEPPKYNPLLSQSPSCACYATFSARYSALVADLLHPRAEDLSEAGPGLRGRQQQPGRGGVRHGQGAPPADIQVGQVVRWSGGQVVYM